MLSHTSILDVTSYTINPTLIYKIGAIQKIFDAVFANFLPLPTPL
jgi:hypothetical protein